MPWSHCRCKSRQSPHSHLVAIEIGQKVAGLEAIVKALRRLPARPLASPDRWYSRWYSLGGQSSQKYMGRLASRNHLQQEIPSQLSHPVQKIKVYKGWLLPGHRLFRLLTLLSAGSQPVSSPQPAANQSQPAPGWYISRMITKNAANHRIVI